jgi:hypothetical protein
MPIVIALASLVLYTCAKPEETTSIDLPATSVLSAKSYFGIITSSHLRLRVQPDITSDAVTTLWRGYVLEILSKDNDLDTVEGQKNYWYQVNYDGLRGWVFGGYVALYESRDEAERAARELRG